MAIINGRGRVGARPSSGGGGSSYDADALAFFTAASITDTTQMSAVNTLVTGLKSNNLWTKIKALYPVVGGNSTAHSKNLKNPSQYNLTFTSGWVHSSTGMLPNGTSAYASTGIKVSDFAPDSMGLGVYLRTNNDGLFCDIGTSDTSRFQLLTRYFNNIYSAFSNSNVNATGAVTDSRGLTTIGRVSTTSRKTFKNGVLKFTSSETITSTTNISTYDFKIGTTGQPALQWYSNRENSLTVFKLALSDAEESILYTLVQAFQTTLGRHVGVPVVSDSDAQAFLNSANISDLTQASAVNTLVTSLKSNGLWSKMKAIYPIVGGNATAHSYNLVNTSQYQLSFSTGWTHSSTGMKPNGTSAYANTGINPYSISTVNNTHISIYSRTSTVTTAQRDFGAFQGSSNPCISLGTNSSSFISDAYNYDNNRITATISDALGLYVGTRTSNVVFKLFKNGSQIGSTNTNTYSGLLPNLDLYLGSANAGGTINGPSNKQYSYASYGVGLNDSEVSVLNTIITTFQTTLGRQV
jgi:hypothetical protein